MQRQTYLLEVVGATHAIGSFSNFLNRRDQKSNQNSNNGNHHKKLDQRKTKAFTQLNLGHHKIPLIRFEL